MQPHLGSGPVDWDAACRTMEVYLARDPLLNEGQKENVRLKAADLYHRREEWHGVPFRLQVELNRRCNVKCLHCGIHRGGTGEFPVERLGRVLDEIGWGVHELMPFLGGEPTLAPLHDIAPLIRPRNIHFNLITNGLLFDRAYHAPIADVIGRVQFSFHAHRREAFERVMPAGGFERVVRNLRDAVTTAAPVGTHVVACMVVMDELLDDMPGYVDFVADLGVQRVVFQKLYPHTRGLERLDPALLREPARVDEALERVAERARARGVMLETNLIQLFRRPDNPVPAPSRFDVLQENVGVVELFHPGFCIATATQGMIEWDGTGLPCCKDHIPVGNHLESGFLEVWNGPGMRALRRSFFERDLRPNCRICSAFYLGHP